MKVVNFDIPHP